MQKRPRNRSFFGMPGENRTHNSALGGACYIHLTKEAKCIKFILFLFLKLFLKLFTLKKVAIFTRL